MVQEIKTFRYQYVATNNTDNLRRDGTIVN